MKPNVLWFNKLNRYFRRLLLPAILQKKQISRVLWNLNYVFFIHIKTWKNCPVHFWQSYNSRLQYCKQTMQSNLGKTCMWCFKIFFEDFPKIKEFNKVCSGVWTCTKMWKNAIFKQKCLLMLYYCCFSLGGNLDFQDFLQKFLYHELLSWIFHGPRSLTSGDAVARMSRGISGKLVKVM